MVIDAGESKGRTLTAFILLFITMKINVNVIVFLRKLLKLYFFEKCKI